MALHSVPGVYPLRVSIWTELAIVWGDLLDAVFSVFKHEKLSQTDIFRMSGSAGLVRTHPSESWNPATRMYEPATTWDPRWQPSDSPLQQVAPAPPRKRYPKGGYYIEVSGQQFWVNRMDKSCGMGMENPRQPALLDDTPTLDEDDMARASIPSMTLEQFNRHCDKLMEEMRSGAEQADGRGDKGGTDS